MTKVLGGKSWQRRAKIPGSDEFCRIGPAVVCMADYTEHNAPKSPQKHRLGSTKEL